MVGFVSVTVNTSAPWSSPGFEYTSGGGGSATCNIDYPVGQQSTPPGMINGTYTGNVTDLQVAIKDVAAYKWWDVATGTWKSGPPLYVPGTYSNGIWQVTANLPTWTNGLTYEIMYQAYDGSWTTPATASFTFSTGGGGPTISSLSPSSGSTAGGQMTTINGNFTLPVTSVTFGAAAATNVSAMPTYISVTVPSGLAGPVDVTVVAANGTVTCSGCYQYVSTGPSLVRAWYESANNTLKFQFSSPIDSARNAMPGALRLAVSGPDSLTIPFGWGYSFQMDTVFVSLDSGSASTVELWSNLQTGLKVSIAPNVFRNTAYAWNAPATMRPVTFVAQGAGSGASCFISYPTGTQAIPPLIINGSFSGTNVTNVHVRINQGANYWDGQAWVDSSVWLSGTLNAISSTWELLTSGTQWVSGNTYSIEAKVFDASSGTWSGSALTTFTYSSAPSSGPMLVDAYFDTLMGEMKLVFDKQINSIVNAMVDGIGFSTDGGASTRSTLATGWGSSNQMTIIWVYPSSEEAASIKQMLLEGEVSVHVAADQFKDYNNVWNGDMGWMTLRIPRRDTTISGAPVIVGASYNPDVNELILHCDRHVGSVDVSQTNAIFMNSAPDGHTGPINPGNWHYADSTGKSVAIPLDQTNGDLVRSWILQGQTNITADVSFGVLWENNQGNQAITGIGVNTEPGGQQNGPYFHTAYFYGDRDELALFCNQSIQNVNTGATLSFRKNQYNGWQSLHSPFTYSLDSGMVLRIPLSPNEADSLGRWFSYGGPPQIQIPSGLVENLNGYNSDQVKDMYFSGGDSTSPGDTTGPSGTYVYINYPSGTVNYSPAEIGGSYGGTISEVRISLFDNHRSLWWSGSSWGTSASGPTWISSSNFGNGQWKVNSGLPNWADSGSYEINAQVLSGSSWFPSQPVKTNFFYCSNCGSDSGAPGGDSTGPQFSLRAEGWHNSAHVDINAYNSQYSSYSMYRIEGSGWNLVVSRPADSGGCFNFNNRPTGSTETYVAVAFRTDGGMDTTNEVTITIVDYGREDMWAQAEVGAGKQYSSIQAAIDATDSAVIRVYPGTYDPIRVDGMKRIKIDGIDTNGQVPIIDGNGGIAVLADTTTDFGRHGEFNIRTFIVRNASTGIRVFGNTAGIENMLIKGANIGVDIARNESGHNSYDGWGYLTNLTIVGTPSGTAGIVCDTPYSGINARNCIIAEYPNGVGIIGGRNGKISYCDFWGVGIKYSGPVFEDMGVREEDPQFVDASTYKLASTSPLISVGSYGEPMGAWFLSGRENNPGGGDPGSYGPRADIHAGSWENMAYVCVSADRSVYRSYTLFELKDEALIDLGNFGTFQECRQFKDLQTGQTLFYAAALEKYDGGFDTVGICTVTVSSEPDPYGGRQGPPPVTVGAGKQFTSLQAAIDATSEGMIAVYPGEYGPITITGAKSLEIRAAEDGHGIPTILGNGGTAITIENVMPPDSNSSGKVHVGGFIIRNASTGVFVSNAEGGIGDMLILGAQRGVVAAGVSSSSAVQSAGYKDGPSTRFGARNVTFIGGSGAQTAVEADSACEGEVIDCIIQGFPVGVAGYRILAAYNNFWQVGTNYTGGLIEWGHDLEVDPQFVADGSYRLKLSSPLLTAGSDGCMGSRFLGDPRSAAVGPTDFVARDADGDENGLVELSWTPPDTMGLVGYYLLRSERKWTPDEVMNGTALEGSDFKWHMLGRVSSFVDTLPKENVQYYFLLGAMYVFSPGDTAHTDPAGGWDGYALAKAIDDVRPLSVTGFEAFDTPGDYGGSITLKWTPSASSDVVGQRIYCLESLADTGNEAAVKVLADTSISVSEFVFTQFRDGTPLQNNKTYYFVIGVIDDAGNDNQVNLNADVKTASAGSNAPETFAKGRQYYGALEIVLSGTASGRADTGALTYNYSLTRTGSTLKTGSAKLGAMVFRPLADGEYVFRAYAQTPDGIVDQTPVTLNYTITGASTYGVPQNSLRLLAMASASKPATILKTGRLLYSWKEDMTVADGLYDRYESQTLTSIEKGRGYWFKNPDSAVSVSLTSTDLLGDVVNKELNLYKTEKGWNMIGNPFCYAVDLSSTGLVFYGWDPATSSYSEPVKVLEPWKGYWVKVEAARTCTIPAVPYFPMPAAKVAKAAADERNWTLQLQARCNGKSDINNSFGVMGIAKAESDPVYYEPPVFDNNLSVFFVAGSAKEMLTREIRQTSASTQTWTFGVSGAAGKVSFQLADLRSLPEKYDVYVGFSGNFTKVNRATGTFELEGTEGKFYELAVTKDADFLVRVGAQFTLRPNFPNPVQGMTVIGYSIPVKYLPNGLRESGLQRVRLDIYNPSGQKIKALVNDSRAAGYYEVVWHGVDGQSRQVSSGVYIYALRTGDKAAQRRMILVK